jgi:hypothetical protein
MGKWRYSLPILTSTIDGGELSVSRTCRLNTDERAVNNHWTGDCMGRRACLDAVEKGNISGLCWESNPGLPVRSLSLYRLRYPVSRLINTSKDFSVKRVMQ